MEAGNSEAEAGREGADEGEARGRLVVEVELAELQLGGEGG